MKKSKVTFSHKASRKRWHPAAAIVLMVSLAVVVHAAGSYAVFEAESGIVSGNVSIPSQTDASGGRAIKFDAPGTAPTCSLNATTANFAAQVAAATAGQTICLATGNYGTWTGTNKAITITAASGATPSMSFDLRSGDGNFTLDRLTIAGGNITGNSGNFTDANNPKNITIKNSTFTAALIIEYLANANILLDNNTHNNISNNSNCTGSPARIHLSYSGNAHSGVTIQNSLLDGGNADGIQAGTAFTALNNEFRNIHETSGNDCAHTDPIQLLGSNGAIIRGNYIHNSADGIVAYDRVEAATIENNVIDLVDGRWGIELYSDKNSIVRHNTVVYRSSCASIFCGQIALDHKSADPAGIGTIIEDNTASALSFNNGSVTSVNRNNMLRTGASGQNFAGTPVFAGGTSPTTWNGFFLASGSPGIGKATDGTNVGIK